MNSELLTALSAMDMAGARAWLSSLPDAEIVSYLAQLSPRVTSTLLEGFDEARRGTIIAAAPTDLAKLWQAYHAFPEESVGRLVERCNALFSPEALVAEVIAELRETVKRALITYLYVVDRAGKLVGVVTFRELLYSAPGQTLADIMVRNPYALRPDTKLVDAMREVVKRHFPVYPVCASDGTLIGQVRGQELFEAQAVDISAQAGEMVGVEKEERLSTPWYRSFMSRHPWLQLNLITAFVAGGVVGFFQGTVDSIALLAVFLPILAGQSGNTGCQSLAVTLRGLTLGELSGKDVPRLLRKEGLLGFMNGATVGLIAAGAMYFYAQSQEHPRALTLAFITWASMVGSCVASGLAGAAVPLTLKRLGADPATASSIFLTTATDVCSMGLFLGLATVLLM